MCQNGKEVEVNKKYIPSLIITDPRTKSEELIWIDKENAYYKQNRQKSTSKNARSMLRMPTKKSKRDKIKHHLGIS